MIRKIKRPRDKDRQYYDQEIKTDNTMTKHLDSLPVFGGVRVAHLF
jgi:hypothetical protein